MLNRWCNFQSERHWSIQLLSCNLSPIIFILNPDIYFTCTSFSFHVRKLTPFVMLTWEKGEKNARLEKKFATKMSKWKAKNMLSFWETSSWRRWKIKCIIIMFHWWVSEWMNEGMVCYLMPPILLLIPVITVSLVSESSSLWRRLQLSFLNDVLPPQKF